MGSRVLCHLLNNKKFSLGYHPPSFKMCSPGTNDSLVPLKQNISAHSSEMYPPRPYTHYNVYLYKRINYCKLTIVISVEHMLSRPKTKSPIMDFILDMFTLINILLREKIVVQCASFCTDHVTSYQPGICDRDNQSHTQIRFQCTLKLGHPYHAQARSNHKVWFVRLV